MRQSREPEPRQTYRRITNYNAIQTSDRLLIRIISANSYQVVPIQSFQEQRDQDFTRRLVADEEDTVFGAFGHSQPVEKLLQSRDFRFRFENSAGFEVLQHSVSADADHFDTERSAGSGIRIFVRHDVL